MNRRIPYGRQHISDEDIAAVSKALKADFITQGPNGEEFEKQFAAYIGCKYAISVANGTAALHLCALALGVNENSKVITTPITFTASANCIRFCGGEVDFADIDPDTILLSIESVRKKLALAPKGTYEGIIPVDFAGYPVDMEAYRKLADEYGCWIIEDACHSPGGYFTDSKGVRQNCGNGVYADLSIFSFHPVKHIACGEGGMITTNDKKLRDKIISLRSHGLTKDPDIMHENHGGWYYEMHDLGFNYRFTDFQAALGISQLSRAVENLKRRKAIAKKYDEAFKGTEFEVILPKAEIGHAYHLYVIQLNDRKKLYDHLRALNILVQIHYIPVNRQPYYKKRGNYPTPNAEAYYARCLSLPMYPTLTDEEQEWVIQQVKTFRD